MTPYDNISVAFVSPPILIHQDYPDGRRCELYGPSPDLGLYDIIYLAPVFPHLHVDLEPNTDLVTLPGNFYKNYPSIQHSNCLSPAEIGLPTRYHRALSAKSAIFNYLYLSACRGQLPCLLVEHRK